LKYVVEDLLGCHMKLTPKCHPEIAGRGVEYAWGYSKLRFRKHFNDAVPSHAFLIHSAGGKDASAAKDEIEHITRIMKTHRSAMDANYSFIVHS
jgi:hypothetical protein